MRGEGGGADRGREEDRKEQKEREIGEGGTESTRKVSVRRVFLKSNYRLISSKSPGTV